MTPPSPASPSLGLPWGFTVMQEARLVVRSRLPGEKEPDGGQATFGQMQGCLAGKHWPLTRSVPGSTPWLRLLLPLTESH